jgi:hypothetical protein
MSTTLSSPACTGPAYDRVQRFVDAWKEYSVTEDDEECSANSGQTWEHVELTGTRRVTD